jgi:hypothetical protein
VGVVEVAFLVIVEDFVGLLRGFEADFGLCAFVLGYFVRVVRKGRL